VNTRGWEAHLGFYPNALPDSMGVVVIYGMATPLHLRWCRDRGLAADPWVGQSQTLLRVQAYAPGWVDKDATPDVDPYRWSFSDDRSAADLGEALAARLREEILPRLQAWFDADALAAAALTGDIYWLRRFMPRELTAAMALAEDGASARIEELLSQAAARDRAGIGDWIREQLRGERPSR